MKLKSNSYHMSVTILKDRFDLGWNPYIPMATALVHLFSDDGFVIAADGFSTLTSAEGRKVVSDHATKIFPIRGIDREAAFSFTGRTTLYDQTESHVAFDFTSAFENATNEVKSVPVGNVGNFLSRVCSEVQERLETTKRSVGLSKYPSPRNRLKPREHTIVTIYLDGYFSDTTSSGLSTSGTVT